MKHRALLLLLPFVIATTTNAQRVSGRFTTSYYAWQGKDTTQQNRNYARAYENVQLDIAGSNFSFNTSLLLTSDFVADIASDPQVRFNTLAFRGRKLFDMFSFALGRHFVVAGAGSGYLDGGSVTANVMDGMLKLTGYGGWNVIASSEFQFDKNFEDNSLYGARLASEPVKDLSVALGYSRRSRETGSLSVTRLDSLFNPSVVVFALLPEVEELVSGETNIDLIPGMQLYARSDYDMKKEDLSRAQFFGRFSVMESLHLTGEYLWREPRTSVNNLFSVFTQSSFAELEFGVEYDLHPEFRTYARFANVSYKEDDETSTRITAGANYGYFNANYTQNFGYAGELSSFSLQGSYPLMDRTVIPTFAVGVASYTSGKDDEENLLLTLNLGGTYRPMPALSVSGTVQYLRNPVFSTDLRFFASVNYWFSERLNIF